MNKVSIIIPAYNEERYIGSLLQKVLSVPAEQVGFDKEIIVVDDGSQDNTYTIASAFQGIQVFQQIPNQGKARAVQRGIQEATGDFILIQDADLEYDPADYLPMLRASGAQPSVAVYGSRTKGQVRTRGLFTVFPGKHVKQEFGPWFFGILLTLWTFCLYQVWITDLLTAYKLYPSKTLKSFKLKTKGFEGDHEITAKLIRSRIRIIEVPIAYEPRTKEEGKKIRPRDGFVAVWTLFKYRFVS